MTTHTETVTGTAQDYTIHVGGTLDGVNTRDPVGYSCYGCIGPKFPVSKPIFRHVELPLG